MIDLHCDTLSKLVKSEYSLQQNPFHLDIKRSVQAGITGQVFALFHYHKDFNVTLRVVLEQIGAFYANLPGSPGVRLIKGRQDLEEARKNAKLAGILHLEGADALGDDASLWPLFHGLGVMSLGLTWNHNNAFAGGVLDPEPTGLSAAGRFLLDEMARLGSILDLAHSAPISYYQALDYFPGAVMVSHANARSLCNHPRNLDNDQLMALAEHKGIIGVNLVSDFVHPQFADISHLIDHIKYICDLIGVEHVALGSDFDGADNLVLDGIEEYRNLPGFLRRRGFSAGEVTAILHDNAYNFLISALPQSFQKRR